MISVAWDAERPPPKLDAVTTDYSTPKHVNTDHVQEMTTLTCHLAVDVQ